VATKFEKSDTMTVNYFFLNQKRYKNAEFHADFNSVDNVFLKMHTKKFNKQINLTNTSKSGKRACFRHVLVNSFILVHF
jgi:hypothetical protein